MSDVYNIEIHKILSENLTNFELSKSYGHRAVGDKIESDCSNIVMKHFVNEYKPPTSKRSIEDFSLVTTDHHNLFDVKTHFIQDTIGFSMPNLISVKRLKKLLENDLQSLSYVFVDYTRDDLGVIIKDVTVKYIWELDWTILSIGALGKGQLQIKDANKQLKFTDIGKQKWFDILKVNVNSFYQKEMMKIKKEIGEWI